MTDDLTTALRKIGDKDPAGTIESLHRYPLFPCHVAAGPNGVTQIMERRDHAVEWAAGCGYVVIRRIEPGRIVWHRVGPDDRPRTMPPISLPIVGLPATFDGAPWSCTYLGDGLMACYRDGRRLMALLDDDVAREVEAGRTADGVSFEWVDMRDARTLLEREFGMHKEASR